MCEMFFFIFREDIDVIHVFEAIEQMLKDQIDISLEALSSILEFEIHSGVMVKTNRIIYGCLFHVVCVLSPLYVLALATCV